MHWSMIFPENRYPPRIKSGAGFFGIMLYADFADTDLASSPGSVIGSEHRSP